jgi:UDPglucose 6-dehydrogenase
LRGRSIAVSGITFKPNADDMRDAPSIPLITALLDIGAEVRAIDPVGMPQAKKILENVTFCNDAYDCAKGAHALVIVTEWEQFRALDLKKMASIMASSVIVDLRNIYSAGRGDAKQVSLLRGRATQTACLLASRTSRRQPARH